jgi:hypothetical protein
VVEVASNCDGAREGRVGVEGGEVSFVVEAGGHGVAGFGEPKGFRQNGLDDGVFNGLLVFFLKTDLGMRPVHLLGLGVVLLVLMESDLARRPLGVPGRIAIVCTVVMVILFLFVTTAAIAGISGRILGIRSLGVTTRIRFRPDVVPEFIEFHHPFPVFSAFHCSFLPLVATQGSHMVCFLLVWQQ